MQRNMDLVRAILLECEQHAGAPGFRVEVPGYSPEEIGYHIRLLGQAGFLTYGEMSTRGDPYGAYVKSLTWAGHEFLDSCRDNSIWQQAKAAMAPLGTAAMPVWQELLSSLLKAALGLS